MCYYVIIIMYFIIHFIMVIYCLPKIQYDVVSTFSIFICFIHNKLMLKFRNGTIFLVNKSFVTNPRIFKCPVVTMHSLYWNFVVHFNEFKIIKVSQMCWNRNKCRWNYGFIAQLILWWLGTDSIYLTAYA